jgi:hypothetical protein
VTQTFARIHQRGLSRAYTSVPAIYFRLPDDLVPDYLDRRTAHRDEHLALVRNGLATNWRVRPWTVVGRRRRLERATTMNPALVTRPDTALMFIETADDPSALSAAWRQLEAALGSTRGRHFLGTFYPGKTYRASVQLRDGDHPAAFPTGVVPGGAYLRLRLRGEPPGLYDRLPQAMQQLEAAGDRDTTRPCIEWYRRRDEVDVLMPVHAAGRTGSP